MISNIITSLNKNHKILRKYKATSSICSYPADDWDYCWSYARSVDKGEKNNCNCNGCEYNTTYKD